MGEFGRDRKTFPVAHERRPDKIADKHVPTTVRVWKITTAHYVCTIWHLILLPISEEHIMDMLLWGMDAASKRVQNPFLSSVRDLYAASNNRPVTSPFLSRLSTREVWMAICSPWGETVEKWVREWPKLNRWGKELAKRTKISKSGDWTAENIASNSRPLAGLWTIWSKPVQIVDGKRLCGGLQMSIYLHTDALRGLLTLVTWHCEFMLWQGHFEELLKR